MGNHALDTNPPSAENHLSTNGSNWLWAVFSIFTLATLAFLLWGLRRPATHRLFFYIVTAICLVSSINYFTWASDLGSTPVPVEFRRSSRHTTGSTRQIFWTKYIDWFITSALILFGLFLTARVPWQYILFNIFLVWTAVVCGLAGAFTATTYKWGYYTFALALLFYVIYSIIAPGRRHVSVLGADISRTYHLAGFWVIFIGLLYPIAWGVSEGGNVIGVTGEAIFYGILDLLLKIGFGVILLSGHSRIEPDRLGLRLHSYEDTAPGARHVEKIGGTSATHATV